MFKKRKTRLMSMAIGATLLIAILGVTATLVFAFTQSSQVTFTLEGCRNDGTITLPILGKFICPDAAYTTGNLGKGWNELDLVPHRLTTSLGNQTGATTDYSVYIAGDYQSSGKIGWDVISVPVVNTAKSDASCSVAAEPQSTLGSSTSPFGGGTDVVVYRLLTIHQAKGTTCVFDWVQRLALGAHSYSGSSLQSYIFEGAGLSGSKKTLSIPVGQILPQSLSKDMSATQGTDHVWDVTKGSTPATLNFGNTCDATAAKSQGLAITVTWTKGPADPSGPITVITHVYATNPSARTITTVVTDKIYSGTTLLNTSPTVTVDVPANTTKLVLTHTFLAPYGTINLNDIASATYTDLITGVAIPGNTTATASAPVQLTGPELDKTAVITDSESITGAELTFSADSFTPATIGSFDIPYTAGIKTTGPVGWTSVSQSGNSSVTFDKTVYVAGPSIVTGTLTDTATVTGSDGFNKSSGPHNVGISTNAKVVLTINKTVDVAQATDTTFDFTVSDGVNPAINASITVLAGQTTGFMSVPGLTPGVTYTVNEVTQNAWVSESAKTVKIDLPACSGSVSFANVVKKDLKVEKTATPSFTRTYKWGISKAVDKTSANIANGGTATFNYQVDVTHDTGTDSAWAVAGDITVTNPNPFAVTGVAVTDAINDPNATCTVTGGSSVTIPANDKAVLAYSCTYSAAPAAAAQVNTATASWTPYGSPNASVSKTADVKWANSFITIVDGSVTITDPQAPNPPLPATVSYTDINPKSFTYSLSFAGVGGKCTKYDNTATFTTNTTNTTGSASQTVTVCVGLDLTVSKTAVPSFTRTFDWTINKSVDKPTVYSAGGGVSEVATFTVAVTKDAGTDSAWALSGVITITNPNDWQDVTLTSLGDAVPGGTCTVAAPVALATSYVIPKSGSLDVAYSCTFAVQPAYNTDITNTATAAWDLATYHTPTGSASGDAKFQFVNPTTLVKDSIHVTDTNGKAWDFSTSGSQSYPMTYTDPAGKCTSHVNTATIVGLGKSADATVTDCQGTDLKVSKTAVPTMTRTFKWGITKSVVGDALKNISGGTATFNYQVDVTHDAGTDSAWALSGVITITNPNDWQDVTLTSLTDVVDNGGACTVAAPADPLVGYVIPKSGSLDVAYSCAWTTAPTNYTGTNSPTATWDATKYHTPNGSAAGSGVSFTFAPTKLVDSSVTVTDPLAATTANPRGILGTASYTDLNPKSFTYSLSFPGVGGKCTKYDNTATFTTNTTNTTGSASQTVTVCVGLDLTVSKTAVPSFTRTFDWTINKSVDKPTVYSAGGGVSEVATFTVAVTKDAGTDSAWALSGVITITNPNDWQDVTLTSLGDAVPGGTCTVAAPVAPATSYVIPKSGSLDVAYSCTFAVKPAYNADITNTATAAWDAATYHTPSGSASGDAKFQFVNPTTLVKDSIHVTDSNGKAWDFSTSGSQSYPMTYTDPAGKCTLHNNTATIVGLGKSADATVTDCQGTDLTVSKTAVPTMTRTFDWTINKSVDKPTVYSAGGGVSEVATFTVAVTKDAGTDSAWALSGVITITNSNDWQDVTLTNLGDAVPGGTCTVAAPVAPATSYVIPKSGSLDVAYSCTFAVKPAYNADITNTATAAWDAATYHTPSGSADGVKVFQFVNPTTLVKDSIHVTDSNGKAWDFSTSGSQSYPMTYTDPAGKCTSHNNTATIVGLGKSADATVTDCQGTDLTVSKTAVPTMTRTFKWGIEKLVDKTSVNLSGTNPQSATFNYTVNVTHDAGTDSLWALSGVITIANSNDWQDVTLTNLTDAVDNGGTCTVAPAPAGGYVIPKSGSLDVAYSCAWTTAPTNYTGTNTPTATWDATKYHTPNGSAAGSGVSFTFAPTTIVDGSVDVTDTLGGNLGTVSYTDLSPKALTYANTFQGVAGTCQKFDNTATFTTVDTKATGSSSQSVQVCASVLNVIKLTQGVVDPTKNWQFNLYAGPHASDPFSSFGSGLASDTSLNKADGILNFGNYNIDPAKTYTFCELNAPAGWASLWTFNGANLLPYNPDRFPTSGFPNGQDLGVRCFDFGAGTAYGIPTGGTITFQVDNRFPGGEPRTIGFWKNWSSCTGGKQTETAAKNGGKDAGYYTLDDVLNAPGITVGSFNIPAANTTLTFTLPKGGSVTKTGCEIAVALLGKSDAATGKNMASDAAYTMVAQLIAAKANTAAGAKNCTALSDAVLAADQLLVTINFTGTGSYLDSKVKGTQLTLRNQAISLADTLDKYNNGLLCP